MDAITRGDGALAKYIDHTLLKPEAVTQDFERLCHEAIAHNFFSVCIPPSRITLAKKLLKNSSVKVCTVIGFPLGYSAMHTKSFEAKTAIEHGADELDMVINISALKSGDRSSVLEDIRSVVRSASGRSVKVILETCYLSDSQKTLACELSLEAGAHFVKTSTGFGPSGATESDIQLMASTVGGKMGIKASGGIRDFTSAKKFIELGATRLGTSNGIAILTGASANSPGNY